MAESGGEISAVPLRTPRSEPPDSDGVLLALETARALEEEGDLREAARWIRRAANEAEKDGNDQRVLALARAAADLTTAIETAEAAGELPARSSLPTIPSFSSSGSTIPPPTAPPATLPPRTDPTLCDAVRVVIRGSIDASSLAVERLAPGEPCPAGAQEALLVLFNEDAPPEWTHPSSVDRSGEIVCKIRVR